MRSFGTDTRSQRVSLLLIAAGVVVLYYFVPYGRYALYPFTLLSTWVHELGHGITALFSGGVFDRLEMFTNGSGLAHVRVSGAWHMSLVAAGGLMAPPLVGALMISLGAKAPRLTLWLFVGLMVASCLLWIRQLTGFLILIPLLALTTAVALWAKQAGQTRTIQLYACVLSLDSLTHGINYMMTPNAYIDGEQRASDITQVAQVLPGPYYVWGGVLALLSVCILVAGLWFAWRTPRVNNNILQSAR